MGQLLLIALATFASEDLTCIGTGALIAAGKLGFLPGVAACIVGIYAGDLLLYFAGRLVGRPIVRWRPLRKFLTDENLDRASQWLSERGAGVVIASRFTPGLRLPTYVAAGILRTRFWTFASYFLLAAVVWTPALVGISVLLGRGLPRLAFVGPALLLVGAPLRKLGRARSFWHLRRRAVGWLRRKTQWEFWPVWLAYAPVVPYILWLALKHRSLTLFTAANPGIPSGGFTGESKSAILSRLKNVPEFIRIPADSPADVKCQAVFGFMTMHGLPFPVVLKPDVGERGVDVVIARSADDVCAYLRQSKVDVIAQKYVAGLEFGVFYSCGRILSITEKRFPSVVGDGVSSLSDLILRDDRAVCLAALYIARLKRPATDVPAAGESVPIAEIGSHCRGSVFLDATHLATEELCDAIDQVAKSHGGFYFGRFDIRTHSVADFQAGRFNVLELNGVTGEPAHIYDPTVSLLEAYRVLYRHWRLAFEIGAVNRRAGARPMSFRELVRLIA